MILYPLVPQAAFSGEDLEPAATGGAITEQPAETPEETETPATGEEEAAAAEPEGEQVTSEPTVVEAAPEEPAETTAAPIQPGTEPEPEPAAETETTPAMDLDVLDSEIMPLATTNFGSVNVGYGQQSEAIVWTVEGTFVQGNGMSTYSTLKDIKATLGGSNPGAFEISTVPAGSVKTDGKTTCGVRPVNGLAAGTYNATLHIACTRTVTVNVLGHTSSGDQDESKDINLVFTVNKQGQGTLYINGTLPTAYNSTASITVSGGNGTGAYSLSSNNTAVAEVTGSNGSYNVRIKKGTGSYTLTAGRAGDSSYNAATSVSKSATATKIAQAAVSISGSFPTQYNSSATITVSGGSSGGNYTLSSSDTSVASVSPTSSATGQFTVKVLKPNASYTLTYGRATDDNYLAISATTGSTATTKTTPTISTAPTAASGKTYGVKLSALTFSGGVATDPNTHEAIAGSFKWVDPTVIPPVSNSGYPVYFDPTDDGYNNSPNFTVAAPIAKATPLLKGTVQVSGITYEQPLSASIITLSTNAVVNPNDNSLLVSGTADWHDGSVILTVPGTSGNGGDGLQPIDFTTGDPNYVAVSTLTWIRPTVAKAEQAHLNLSGTAPTEYNSTSSMQVSGGSGTGAYTLKSSDPTAVSITPASSASGEFTLTVLKPDVTYNLTFGRNADVNYLVKSSVSSDFITRKATPVIDTPPLVTKSSTYGVKLSDLTLTGGVARDPNTNEVISGTFKWEEPATVPTVGNTGYQVYFEPTNKSYNNSVSFPVTPIITKAVPVLAIAPQLGGITYGQLLSDSTITAAAGAVVNPIDSSLIVEGTMDWQDGSVVLTVRGTRVNGGDGLQPIDFTTDNPNYEHVTTITWMRPKVAKADVVVSAWPHTEGTYIYGTIITDIPLLDGTVKSAVTDSHGVAPSGTFYWLNAGVYPTVTNSGAGSNGYVVAFNLDAATKENYNDMTATRRVTVSKVEPRELKGTWVANDKIYDGSAKATVTFKPDTSGSGSLVAGDSADAVLGQITAEFVVRKDGKYVADANAEDNKKVAVRNMKLLGAVPNYSLPADLKAYLADTANTDPPLTEATIEKADGGGAKTLLIKAVADRPAQTYTSGMYTFVPNKVGPSGTVDFHVGSKTDADGILGTPSMSGDTLQVPVNAVAWDGAHGDATFTVTVETQNYTDVPVHVTVHMYPLIEAHLWISSAPDKVYDGISYRQARADSTITVPPGYDGNADTSTGKVPAGSIEFWYEGFGDPNDGGTNYGPSKTPPTDAGEYKVWAVATGDYTGQSEVDYFRISKRTITVVAPSVSVDVGDPLPELNDGEYLVEYAGVVPADAGETLYEVEAEAAYTVQNTDEEGYYNIDFLQENGGKEAVLNDGPGANYVLKHMTGLLTVGNPGGDVEGKIPLHVTAVQYGGEDGLITSKNILLTFTPVNEGDSVEWLTLPENAIRLSGTGVVYGGGVYNHDGANAGGNWGFSVTGSYANETLAKLNVILPSDSLYTVVDKDVDVMLYRDAKPPEAQVAYKNRQFYSFLNTVSFGLFFKDTTHVYISATDEGSDVEIEYYLDLGVALGDTEPVNGWAPYTSAFSVNGRAKFALWARVTDAEGNRAVYKDGVVVYTDIATFGASAVTDRYSEEDVASTYIAMNGNAVSRIVDITNANEEALPPSVWEAVYGAGDDSYVVLKGFWLRTLAQGSYTLRVEYAPLGETYVADNRGTGGSDINEAPSSTILSLTVRGLTQEELQVIGLPESRTFTYGIDTGFVAAVTGGSGTGALHFAIEGEAVEGSVARINADTGEVTLHKPGTFIVEARKDADSVYKEAVAHSEELTFMQAEPAVSVTVNIPSATEIDISAQVLGVDGNMPRGTVDFKGYPLGADENAIEDIAFGVPLDENGVARFTLDPEEGGRDFSGQYVIIAQYTPMPVPEGPADPTYGDLGTDAWYLPASGESTPFELGKKDQEPLEFIGAFVHEQDPSATAEQLVYGGGLLDALSTAMLHAQGGSTGGEITWTLISGPADVEVSGEGALTLGGAGRVIVRATMAGDETYNPVSGTFVVEIGKATPGIAGAAGSAVVYGQRLNTSVIGATISGVSGSGVPGQWHWKQESILPDVNEENPGTPLTYTAVFTPSDLDSYLPVTLEVPVPVNPATPIVSQQPRASSIAPGEALGASVIVDNGKVYALIGSVYETVAGSWSWDPTEDLTSPYNVEGDYSAAAVFTPADTLRFTQAAGTATFTVSHDKTVVTEPPTVRYLRGAGFDPSDPNPAWITYGKYLVNYVSLEEGGVHLDSDDSETDIPGAWYFCEDARRADTPGTMKNVAVMFVPADPSVPVAYATVDIKVGKAALTLRWMPAPADIRFGQTFGEWEASGSGMASSTDWLLTGAFGETVAGTLEWTDEDLAPTDEDAIYISNNIVFYPAVGTNAYDDWSARYVSMSLNLQLHVKPSQWDEMVTLHELLVFWKQYIVLGQVDGVVHADNYRQEALDALEAAIEEAQALIDDPVNATERQTNSAVDALEAALAGLKHDHPILDIEVDNTESNVVIAQNEEVEIRIKGVFTDVYDVTIDGQDIMQPGRSHVVHLTLNGERIGTLTEGSALITLHGSYVNTLSEGAHTLEVHFADEFGEGEGVCTFYVDWPSSGGGGGSSGGNGGQSGGGGKADQTVSSGAVDGGGSGSNSGGGSISGDDDSDEGGSDSIWQGILDWLKAWWWALLLVFVIFPLLLWWLLLWKRRKKEEAVEEEAV
ncbi:MAG: hypothetical protein LBR14_01780 [Clostridiales Family XIII bacterium]|nr:hypothetical protein [Clostridiales Family XIII bacterium]